MDAPEFVEWVWSIADEDKAAIAGRVAKVRAGTNERFLREARSAAESAIAGTGFDPHVANVAAAPEDALDEGEADLETWNRDVGNDLRAAYEDAMLAFTRSTAPLPSTRRAPSGHVRNMPWVSHLRNVADDCFGTLRELLAVGP